MRSQEVNSTQHEGSAIPAAKKYKSISVDEYQKKVIESDEGPFYITAGPGAGKTRSMVYRVVNLILKNQKVNKDFGPENIMMLTFTRKAALEFKTRLALELGNQGITLNLSDMYLGTFDSQCFTLWGEYRHNLNEKKVLGWQKLLDDAKSSTYTMDDFKNGVKDIFNKDADERLLKSKAKDKQTQEKAEFADQYTVIEYIIATELLTHEKVIADLKKKIKYVIVDEAQDNNTLQWEIINRLFDVTQNICVVGDVNQSIYAFRDAQPDQFQGFLKRANAQIKFDLSKRSLTLEKNYRSNGRIVEFCNMYLREGAPKYSNPLQMKADKESSDNAVAYLTIENDRDAASSQVNSTETSYHGAKALASQIIRLKKEKIICDYSDVAILTTSVQELNRYHYKKYKEMAIQGFVERLEEEGNALDSDFHVYAPRAGLLLDCKEIKELLGCAANRIGYTNIDDDYQKAAEYCYKRGVPKIKHTKTNGEDYHVAPADYSDVCCQLLCEAPFCNITKNTTEYENLHLLAEYFYLWDSESHSKTGNINHSKPRNIKTEPIFTLLTKKTNMIQHPICQQLIGSMILRIKHYQKSLTKQLDAKGKSLMEKCLKKVGTNIGNQKKKNYQWAFRYGDKAQLKGLQRYWNNLSEILYELLEYEPFCTYISTSAAKIDAAEQKETVNILRVRNIATLLTYVSEKEAEGMRRESILNELFKKTLINEYEERESDHIPGHVTVTTIHQSKGLEYPVVFVDVTNLNPSNQDKEEKRKYYTAFSRAENLLVLLHLGKKNKDKALAFLPESEKKKICDLSEENALKGIGSAKQKSSAEFLRTYSFTADYSVYERCPRMYKYTKLLGFPTPVSRGVAKGLVAHSVVEQINRIHSEGKEEEINSINDEWISDRIRIAEELNKPLSADERNALKDNLHQYHSSFNDKEKQIRFIEKTLNTIQTVKVPDFGDMDYIISGQVDLVEEDDHTLTVYDFKTGRADEKTIGHYIRQLLLYVSLVKEKLSKEVTKAVLYYLDSNEKIECTLNNSSNIEKIYRVSDNKSSVVLEYLNDLTVKEVVGNFDKSIGKIMGCRYNKNDLTPIPENGFTPCIKYSCPMFSYCKRELLQSEKEKSE